MESILTETKKIVGIAEEYTAFDVDMIMFINSALSAAEQAGVGLTTKISIIDKEDTWSSLGLPDNNLSLLKNFVYLKAKLQFDPPGTSFGIKALEDQIEEMAYRMNVNERMRQAAS